MQKYLGIIAQFQLLKIVLVIKLETYLIQSSDIVEFDSYLILTLIATPSTPWHLLDVCVS